MKPFSIQLYTVRENLAQDLHGTLKRLAETGYTLVEPFAFTQWGKELQEALTAHDLQAPTAHISLVGKPLEEIFEGAKALGVSTIIDPMVDPNRWLSRGDVEEVAKELNEVSRQASDHGLTVGYHNHAFEIESIIDGVSALEIFADVLDERVVLEVDSYWVSVGGQDPIALLEKLAERVAAVHIKDGPITKENLDQVAVGAGDMPIKEILAASPHALHVVELDDFRGEIFTAVRDSYEFLAAAQGE